jgi:hypothetical protein
VEIAVGTSNGPCTPSDTLVSLLRVVASRAFYGTNSAAFRKFWISNRAETAGEVGCGNMARKLWFMFGKTKGVALVVMVRSCGKLKAN